MALRFSKAEKEQNEALKAGGEYLRSFYFLWNGIKIYMHVCASAIIYVA